MTTDNLTDIRDEHDEEYVQQLHKERNEMTTDNTTPTPECQIAYKEEVPSEYQRLCAAVAEVATLRRELEEARGTIEQLANSYDAKAFDQECLKHDLQMREALSRAEKAEAERDMAIREIGTLGTRLGKAEARVKELIEDAERNKREIDDLVHNKLQPRLATLEGLCERAEKIIEQLPPSPTEQVAWLRDYEVAMKKEEKA